MFKPSILVGSALTALALAGLAGCGSPASTPAAPSTGQKQIWKATYGCTQGLTGLTLVLTRVTETELTATFYFYAVPGNLDVPAGMFSMKGTYDPATRTVSLRQDRWIQNPADYLMVDLRGTVDAAGRTFTGQVDYPGCSDFHLELD
jgi:hypothetical protein